MNSVRVILLVLLGGVVGTGAYLWSRGYRGPDGILSSLDDHWESKAKATTSKTLEDHSATEGRWLVDQVTRDIAEIILFASDPAADASQVLDLAVVRKTYDDTYEVTATGPKGSLTHTVTLKHHVWSPSDHTPWAAAVLKAWGPEQPAGGSVSTVKDADGVALVMQLTDPTSRNVVREERRLSGLLTQSPLDPELHEQAALLIGTFALRENAGDFSDLRPALCRMAAHLSLARALRPASGTCGKLAEVIQLTLAMRQTEALELLEKLPAGLDPWVMALKLRNTGDWRLCSSPEKATFLEQMTWARALALGVSPAPLQNFLGKHLSESTAPDWSRAAMNCSFSVEQGHVFLKPSIGLELEEFATASEAWDGRQREVDELLSYLNEPACRAVGRSGGGFELVVLGWGQIAASHQRHLCNAIYRTDYFLRDMWAVPDQAAGLESQIHEQFSGLRLYPLLLRRMMFLGDGIALSPAVLEGAMRDAADMCQEHPQLVTAANWAFLTRSRRHPLPVPAPEGDTWFQPSLPKNTAFDFEQRIYSLKLPPLEPRSQDYKSFWDRVVALAPYDYDILRSYVASNPSKLPPVERDKQAFKNVSEFNVFAMRQIAGHAKNDGRKYAAAMALVCALEPDEYLVVARRLRADGLEQEAAVAYQAAFDKAQNRVAVANSSEWIVNYYFDHGRKEDALKIALHAAEVYSASGLECAAKLMERMERWEEAAGYYKAIQERYDDPGPMLRFASRRKETDPALAELYNSIISAQYPQGIKKVKLADFNGAPDRGVAITSETEHTRYWRLKTGDIIVALDGVRTETFSQYSLVRSLQPEEAPMTLIIWDGTCYREGIVQVPERRFGCDMETYRK